MGLIGAMTLLVLGCFSNIPVIEWDLSVEGLIPINFITTEKAIDFSFSISGEDSVVRHGNIKEESKRLTTGTSQVETARGSSGGSNSGFQGAPYEVHAASRYEDRHSTKSREPNSTYGHLLLGGKIILAALGVFGTFYYFSNAIRLGNALEVETGFFYVIAAASCCSLSVAMAVTIFFSI